MLPDDQQYFISILADFLNNRKTQLREDIDLSSLAEKNQVTAIVGYQTKDVRYQPAVARALHYSANMRDLLTKIHAAFTENGIQYSINKGTEIAKYYRVPDLRVSGDIDLLVRKEQKEKAADILLQMGFSLFENKDDHEWQFSNGTYNIELHHRLLYDDKLNSPVLTAFTDKAWDLAGTDDGIRYHMDLEFHFVFLLLHIRKHLIWSGIGIRQFLDLAVMVRNADLNWEKIRQYLSEIDLTAFASVCFSLISRWFQIDVPFSQKEITEDFFESATGTILTDGVFGSKVSEDIAEKEMLNAVRRQGRVRAALAVVFPPYRDLVRRKQYSYLQGRPFLLPLAWLHRIIASVIGKRALNSIKTAQRTSRISTDLVDQHDRVLEQWGL